MIFFIVKNQFSWVRPKKMAGLEIHRPARRFLFLKRSEEGTNQISLRLDWNLTVICDTF